MLLWYLLQFSGEVGCLRQGERGGKQRDWKSYEADWRAQIQCRYVYLWYYSSKCVSQQTAALWSCCNVAMVVIGLVCACMQGKELLEISRWLPGRKLSAVRRRLFVRNGTSLLHVRSKLKGRLSLSWERKKPEFRYVFHAAALSWMLTFLCTLPFH